MKKIYTYLDYRQYLADFYADRKATTRYFSYRYFNRKAGIASPSLFKQVMAGKRNLTGAMVEKFITGLELKPREAAYFKKLVACNQEKRKEAQAWLLEELLGLAGTKKWGRIHKDQFEIYNNWWTLAIREMAGLESFREDPKWISARLFPKVPVPKVKQALALLKQTGLLKYDADGKLMPAEPVLTTGERVRSAAVRKFHQQMIELGGRAIDAFPRSAREISGLTVAVSEKNRKEITKKILALEEDVLKLLSRSPGKADRLYEMNIQFFPLEKTEK